MAQLLFVHAGDIRLIPELHGHEVKLGSVGIGHSDPFRRFLIGAAPFLFGTLIILTTIITGIHYDTLNKPWLLAIIGYLTFEIGNTMFSSKKDMEGAIELLIALVIIIGILLLFRIHIETPIISLVQTKSLEPLFRTCCLILAAPLVLDIVIIVAMKGISRIFTK